MNRNLWYLVSAQTFFLISNIMFLTLASILGLNMSTNDSLSTLPMAITILTMLVCSYPLSMWMGRRGRQPAFVSGLLANGLASVIIFFSIQMQSFSVLLIGSGFLGVAMACANFYRFAAMELVNTNQHTKAISAIMVVGVIAALAGPRLAVLTKNLYFDLEFSSSALTILPLSLVALVFIFMVRWPTIQRTQLINEKKPSEIFIKERFNPQILKPIFAAMVVDSVMVLVMTATPLQMSHQNFAFTDIAWVIQWHVIGMFAPSLIVGKLMRRVGLHGLMIIGGLIMAAAIVANLIATEITMLTVGLLLLGVGWNFVFLGSSQWLVKLTPNKSASKIQGINEICVFGFAAIATFGAGWLFTVVKWDGLNLLVSPLLGALLIVLLMDLRKPCESRVGVAA